MIFATSANVLADATHPSQARPIFPANQTDETINETKREEETK
jgi:hypothetical protein